jgi:hypothetical protein
MLSVITHDASCSWRTGSWGNDCCYYERTRRPILTPSEPALIGVDGLAMLRRPLCGLRFTAQLLIIVATALVSPRERFG